jgi:hypothetical protein
MVGRTERRPARVGIYELSQPLSVVWAHTSRLGRHVVVGPELVGDGRLDVGVLGQLHAQGHERVLVEHLVAHGHPDHGQRRQHAPQNGQHTGHQ